MTFDEVFCFSEIVIVNSHWSEHRHNLDDLKVYVVNRDTGTKSLCGILTTRAGSNLQAQTYSISGDKKCGNEVKLTLYHGSGKYAKMACIHMAEIMAFIDVLYPG